MARVPPKCAKVDELCCFVSQLYSYIILAGVVGEIRQRVRLVHAKPILWGCDHTSEGCCESSEPMDRRRAVFASLSSEQTSTAAARVEAFDGTQFVEIIVDGVAAGIDPAAPSMVSLNH